MNRRGSASLVISMVVLIALILTGIWYYKTHQLSPSPIERIPTAATARSNTPIFQDGYITINPSSTPAWFTYQDSADAYHFQFPSPLKRRDRDVDWGLLNSLDGTQFVVLTTYASSDPKLYNDKIITPLTIENQTINGLPWTFWTFEGGAGYYIYHDNEAISLKIYAPDSSVVFSSADLQILKQIVPTFEFDDISSRMDNQLANLKIGQMFGSLTISKILPAEDFSQSGYATGIFGEVNFTGQLTLTGGSVDDSALNGYWNGLYGIDASSTALIPNIGSVVYNVPIDGWLNYFQRVQLNKVPSTFNPDASASVVVDNLKEIFLPGGGSPEISADFMESIGEKP